MIRQRVGRGRAVRRVGPAILAVLSAAGCAAAQQDATDPPTALEARCLPEGGCEDTLRVAAGRVEHGEPFEAALPGGLVFRLEPAVHRANPPGWTIRVFAAGAPRDDCSSVATPPFRFSNARLIGTSYGMTPQAAVEWTPREFWFVTNPADFAAARDALGVLLWPGAHTEAEVDAARAAFAAIPGSRAALWIDRAELSPPGDEPARIEWMEFQIYLYP